MRPACGKHHGAGGAPAVARLPPLAAPVFFYRLWTLKESLLKAMGTGDPRRITVRFEGPGSTAPWRLLELEMPEGTVASACH